ncbi:MAG: hypothetical protein RB191_13880, partial [Terriglobia bacterium]|nr:hypothetical protein [Terriglobia bacterium]
LLKTGQNVTFSQDEPLHLRLTGLPVEAPDSPSTVIEVECESEPIIDAWGMVPLWPRYKVDIS